MSISGITMIVVMFTFVVITTTIVIITTTIATIENQKKKNTRSEVLLHNLMSETMHAFDYEEDWAKYLKLEIGMTEEELSYMKAKYNYPDMPKKEE